MSKLWIVNELEEAEVYFYGADDPDASKAEQMQTMEIIKAFWSKVVLDQVKIEELEENTDLELYRLSREIGREICLCLTKISVLKRFVRSAD